MADTFLTETAIKDRKRPQKTATPSPPKNQEIPQETQLDKDKRQWNQILKKIAFSPPDE